MQQKIQPQMTFGEWTALSIVPKQERKRAKATEWKCRCSCGSMANIESSNLILGRSTRCNPCKGRVRLFDYEGWSKGCIAVLAVGRESLKIHCSNCDEDQLVARLELTQIRNGQTRPMCSSCRAAAPKRPHLGVKGADHPKWKGEAVGYSAAHRRIESIRGLASDHPCVDCAAPAKDWSRMSDRCDGMLYNASNLPYCTHPEHYDPRCRDCHNRHDHR